MKKSRLLIAPLMLGIVFWLSLFFTGSIVYADDKIADDISSSITISGINQTEKDNIVKVVKEINVSLHDAGYFKIGESGFGYKKTELKDTDFLFAKADRDTSQSNSKNNNTDISKDCYYVTVTANWKFYTGYDTDQQTEIYQIVLSKLQTTKELSQASRVKLYNYFVDSDSTTANLVRQLSTDVNADFGSGYAWIKPFTGAIGTLFGVIAIIIFLGLTLSILIDLAFIVIPSLQLLDDGKEPPHFLFLRVSNEAWSAVHESGKADGGMRKLAISLYLQTRVKQIFVIGLCLLYLVSGKIYTLLASIIDAFQGMLPQ